MLDPNSQVLIVDDFATMRRIVINMLRQVGYQKVLEAADGLQALELLRRSDDIGLIVCDWNMPQMTGIELLRAVRSNPKTKTLPFLMVTAEAKRENIIEAIGAGVSNYLTKPFTKATLAEKLAAMGATTQR